MELEGGINTKIYLAVVYSGSGDQGRARSILKELEDRKDDVSPAEMAILYGALGERERALVSLEKAYAEHDSN